MFLKPKIAKDNPITSMASSSLFAAGRRLLRLGHGRLFHCRSHSHNPTPLLLPTRTASSPRSYSSERSPRRSPSLQSTLWPLSLPGRGSLRRLLLTDPQPAAAASSFRRSFQSEEGAGESVDEFAKRLFNQTGQDDNTRIQEDGNTLYGKLDGTRNSFRRQGTGSGMGDFDRHGGRGNPGFGDRNGFAGSMDGFDSLDDGMNEKLDDAARTFHMTDEVEDDDYDFRPDVNYRRGSTYSVKDLDLTRPAAPRNTPRPQFETTTKDVLRKADFRNVRFLSNFLTEAGIIIKRNQTKISAKAQRKVAREIKTARALGLMPFTTMGKRPFIFGRSVEEDPSEEEYGYDFVEQKDAGPEDIAGDAVPDVEAA